MQTGLSSGDLIGLISLLVGIIFAASWLFQRLGEARIKSTVSLREEVDASVKQLSDAIEQIRVMQELTSTTVERVIRSLDVSTAHIETLGGVIQDLLRQVPDAGYPEYAKVHSSVVAMLRRANDELRILSPDPERRLSAVKNMAFGHATLRSLDTVEAALVLYPDDKKLNDYAERLRAHLRSSTR